MIVVCCLTEEKEGRWVRESEGERRFKVYGSWAHHSSADGCARGVQGWNKAGSAVKSLAEIQEEEAREAAAAAGTSALALLRALSSSANFCISANCESNFYHPVYAIDLSSI